MYVLTAAIRLGLGGTAIWLNSPNSGGEAVDAPISVCRFCPRNLPVRASLPTAMMEIGELISLKILGCSAHTLSPSGTLVCVVLREYISAGRHRYVL